MTSGAFCIFLNKAGEVLLCLRQDKPLWNLPGGKVEVGESPWAAAEREVQEEIGTHCSIERLQGVYHKPTQDEIVFLFLAQIISGKPQLSNEVADIQYFSLDDLPQNTAPLQRQRLEWFKDSKEEFLMREH